MESPIFNLFDTSFESTKLYKQWLKDMEASLLPPRVDSLRLRDFALVKNYCDGDRQMSSVRVAAVDLILHVCHRMWLGSAAAWSAIRLFDEFYCRTNNSAWREQWRTVVAAVVDVSGKVASDFDRNACEMRQHLLFMYKLICDDPNCLFPDWKQFFEYVQSVVLRTLDFNVSVATPNEYISECTKWMDGVNAARGLQQRPEGECVASEMTMYICMVIAHSHMSMSFSTLEIVGFASYVSTSPIRSAPQTERIDTPALNRLWTHVAWTKSNKLSQIMVGMVKYLSESMPNSTLASLYPNEHAKWIAISTT